MTFTTKKAAQKNYVDSVIGKNPSKSEKILLRILIVLGVYSLITFSLFIFKSEHAGNYSLYLLLCVSISYKSLRILHEWYHYWSIGIPEKPILNKRWTVDMFTTAVPGEPFEMIQSTLQAMKKVRYPHLTYLCDEGNDPRLRNLCKSLDVHYVTRIDKSNAKAGNINNALKEATGDICVILDPDHEPLPNFLDEVLPYFEDFKIGFVQVVQAYKNVNESLIASGAAQQTYTFYGPLMMGMNSYGVVQAIGANCTFRREALDSIGGHAAGLAEDMHTAMQLHAKGWKSVYVPEIVTRGLVPETISAYYKQQLKWSRGTFDLLFYVYPRLFKNFTWRQKLHYFLLPLHYLAGLIMLLDFTIPICALLSGETPLLIEVDTFLLFTLPVLGTSLLIRLYAQRWLIEKKERGLHLVGSILLAGTWWVFLLGTIYTLLKIKVPYIATPKAFENKNNWLLSLPNISVCLISLGAIFYGLSRDWNPYNFVMAGYAVINIFLLSIIVLAGQHLLLHQIVSKCKNTITLQYLFYRLQLIKAVFLPNAFHFISTKLPLLIVIISFSCSSILLINSSYKNDISNRTETFLPKKTGGLYTGIYMPAIQENNSLKPLIKFENQIGNQVSIVSIYQAWGPESLEKFPQKLLHNIHQQGSIPMITWEPHVSLFPEIATNPELKLEKKGLLAIATGKFNNYIRNYALKIRDYNQPVFIRFAHEADNPAYPWSTSGDNTPEEYKAAWRQVVTIFTENGVNNVTWVWTPWSAKTINNYYPGNDLVDWVGLTCLNYGTAAHDGKWRDFKETYQPFRSKLLKFKKPIMLAEFGSTNYGGNGTEWIKNNLVLIKQHYKEIKSIIFFNNNQDRNWITTWRPSTTTQYINWEIKAPEMLADEFKFISLNAFKYHEPIIKKQKQNHSVSIKNRNQKYSYLTGQWGNYVLLVDKKNFYIKGVAYNSGNDWRNGNHPLTRKQLEKDFIAIKALGANTIRHYQPSIYDKNLLTIAKEKELKVLYGFYFDPQVNYITDSAKVKEYIAEVEEKVLQYKDYPAVLGWNIGNSTSSMLEKHYEQPYLTIVRKAYLHMIEIMAQRIHKIDPNRPVFTALDYTEELPGELYAYQQLVPSVDIISINAYYAQHLIKVHQLTASFNTNRPYLISEFSSSGYWDPKISCFDNHKNVMEESDQKKAVHLASEWQNLIKKNKGFNIGGIVLSWRDRLDGSATWFGLTDYKGRKKQAYFTLQKAWTGKLDSPTLPKVHIIGPSFKLHTDSVYTFKALYFSKKPVNIEWKLYSENTFQEIDALESINFPAKIMLLPLRRESKSRLYVYVYDNAGNVTTASKAITTFK